MSMRFVSLQLSLSLSLLGALACNVEGDDTTTTGVELPNEPAPEDPDPRGFVVLGTDYASTSVSLVDASGEVLSPVFIGSASAATGLSTALSGDVVPPSGVLAGDEVVLIDRDSAVLTWVNLETAAVRAQLNVGTGFASNPQDYVPVSERKAYVTRFEQNGRAGLEDFDQGDDVLIIDPSEPRVVGRIDLTPLLEGEDPSYRPRAARALAAGGRVLLLAQAATPTFDFLDTRLVVVDPETDAIEQVLVLEGMKSCANLALSPEGDAVAIACNGAFSQDPAQGYPDAGIVIVTLGDEVLEKARFTAAELGGEQISTLAYASASSLLYTTYGRYGGSGSELVAPDTLRRLDLERGAIDDEPLAASRASAFSLADVRCAPGAGSCLLADTETDGGVLRRFEVASDGRVSERGQVAPNPELGLPPRYLGAY